MLGVFLVVKEKLFWFPFGFVDKTLENVKRRAKEAKIIFHINLLSLEMGNLLKNDSILKIVCFVFFILIK